MKVSIIIAVKEFNYFLKECIQKCLSLNFQDYEIILLPDVEFSFTHERARIIPTGPCFPADKRDKGAEIAKGELLAFLDDDAYPEEQWLANAVKNFQDSDVAAIGGPAVTPASDSFLRKASGLVYESFAASGDFRYRYMKDKRRLVEDHPSCNLIVRKSVFDQIGGFKTNFWPGEDTVLCLEITKKLEKKIVYDPEVLVFHHRRPLYQEHLAQIQNYALHRGYFVKKFPETSRKWQYFMPTLLLSWFVFGLLLFKIHILLLYAYLFSILAYFSFIFVNAYQEKDLKMTGHVTLGIFLTHVYYGYYFLMGLMSLKLREETQKDR